jgi:hypothetical protein
MESDGPKEILGGFHQALGKPCGFSTATTASATRNQVWMGHEWGRLCHFGALWDLPEKKTEAGVRPLSRKPWCVRLWLYQPR